MGRLKSYSVFNRYASAFARYYFRFSRIVARWPIIDFGRLQKVINDLGDDKREKFHLEDELRDLKIGSNNGIIIYIQLMITIAYCLKCLLFVYLSLGMFDNSISSPRESLFIIHPDGQLVSFGCMTTNCSDMMQDSSFSDQLLELPMFAICDPLSSLYPFPFKYLERVGLLLFAAFGVGVLINGSVIPMAQIISPRSSESSLFANTPRLATALMKLRLFSIVAKLNLSRERYEARDRELMSKHPFIMPNRPMMPALEFTSIGSEAPAKLSLPTGRARNPYLSITKNQLPIIRSEWFLRRSTLMLCANWSIMFVSAIVTFEIAYNSYMKPQILSKARSFQQLDHRLSNLNCSIWFTESLSSSSSSSTLTYFRPTQIDLGWSWIGLIESLGVQVIPALIIGVGFNVLYITSMELICWQSELQNQLLFLIDFRYVSVIRLNNGTKNSNNLADHSRLKVIEDTPVLVDILIERLRREFKRTNRLSILFLKANLIQGNDSGSHLSPSFLHSRLQSSLSFQILSQQGIDLIKSKGKHVNPEDLCTSLMERVYANFCSYMDFVGQSSPSMEVIFSHSYSLLFGLMFVAVWYCNRISGDLNAPILIVTFVFAFTNYILLIGSAIHANGKGLHIPIWSLIASFTGSSDSRIVRLVSLWQKQVRHLDSMGGVAIRALGFRVTYVKVVQLIVWLATMIVFSTQL